MLFRSIVGAAGSQGVSCLPDVHLAPWSIYLLVLGCKRMDGRRYLRHMDEDTSGGPYQKSGNHLMAGVRTGPYDMPRRHILIGPSFSLGCKGNKSSISSQG